MAYPFPYSGQQPFQYQDQLSQLRNSSMPMPGQNFQPMARQDPSGLNWVQGEAAAKSWIVAPGSTVLPMDSESMRFYLKSADMSGVPAMRTFEYNEVGTQKPQETPKTAQYVTVEAFNEFKNEVIGKLDELSAPVEVSLSRKKKGVADE